MRLALKRAVFAFSWPLTVDQPKTFSQVFSLGYFTFITFHHMHEKRSHTCPTQWTSHIICHRSLKALFMESMAVARVPHHTLHLLLLTDYTLPFCIDLRIDQYVSHWNRSDVIVTIHIHIHSGITFSITIQAE